MIRKDQSTIGAIGRSSWLFNLLGGLVTSVTLISVIQEWFDVGLAPILAGALRAYRELIHPIAGFFMGWLHWIWPDWSIPAWAKDLFALSMFGGALLARYQANRDRYEFPGYPEYTTRLIATGLTVFYGLTFIGFLVVVTVPFTFLYFAVSHYWRNYLPEGPEPDREIVIGFLTGAAGALLFFLINAKLR